MSQLPTQPYDTASEEETEASRVGLRSEQAEQRVRQAHISLKHKLFPEDLALKTQPPPCPANTLILTLAPTGPGGPLSPFKPTGPWGKKKTSQKISQGPQGLAFTLGNPHYP